jgi:iron(III) transport system permease protein
VLLFTSLGPVLAVAFMSVRSAPGPDGTFVGLDNWMELLETPAHIQATFGLALGSAIVTLPLGVLMAWLLSRTNVPLRGLLVSLMPLPLLISSLLMVVAYITVLSPRTGLLNALLGSVLGVRFDIYSVAGMILIMSLNFVPFVYYLVVAALDAVDARYEEALRSAGGGLLSTVRYVSLPLVLPALMSAALVLFIFGLESFSVPTLLGPTVNIRTMQSDIYFAMVDFPSRPGVAAAAGMTLMLVAGLGLWLRNRVAGDPRRYVALSGRAASRGVVDLGPARWLAFALIGAYLVLAIGIPYVVLVVGSFMRFVTPNLSWDLFTLRNYEVAFAGEFGRGLQNSLITGVAAATTSVLIALVIAHVAARQRSRLAISIQSISTLPLVVPTLSLGLGLLWVYVLLPLPIYGTIWVLIIAYCTRYIGSAMLIMSSRLSQIDPELHEALRVSGGSERQAFTLVTLPLAKSAVSSAWVLLFCFAIMEVTMTIMLYTSASATTPVRIWELLRETGGGSGAHALGAILATVSFVVLALQARFSRSGQVAFQTRVG